jgi:Flp pilus assembly protein TadD
MKSCPACNRTFEDRFSFCLVDGSILSAPFDPDAPRHESVGETNDPPPTEVIPASAPAALNPTQPSPPVAPPGPTIRANYQPAARVAPSTTEAAFVPARQERKPNLLVWLLGAVALLLVIVIVIAIAMMFTRSGTPQTTTTANSAANTAATPSGTATPDEAKAHLERADVFKAEKRYPEAELEYKEAIRINPKSHNAHVGLAYVYTRVNRNAEAEAEYREALRVKPDIDQHRAAAIHYNIGKALYDQQKYGEAEAEYREAIRLDPNLGTAHMNLGLALFQLKRYDEAESELREAVRLSPNEESSHHNLAVVLEKQNKSAEAKTEYAKADQLKKQQSP